MKEKQTGSCESCTYYIYDDEYESYLCDVIVELGMQELDCRPRAQIAAADADDNQHLRVAADLLRRL